MSFDPTLPTDRDRARLRLGDTGEPPIIPDAAYDALFALGLDYNETLAQLAESLGAYWLASEGTEATFGDQKVKTGGKSKYYFDLAKSLRADLPTGTGFSDGGLGTLPEPCPNTLDYNPYEPCPAFRYPYGGTCVPRRSP